MSARTHRLNRHQEVMINLRLCNVENKQCVKYTHLLPISFDCNTLTYTLFFPQSLGQVKRRRMILVSMFLMQPTAFPSSSPPLPVYFLSAAAVSESEEGAVCNSSGLCGLGTHGTPPEETQQKEEAGSGKVSAEDSGHPRPAATLSKTCITKERSEKALRNMHVLYTSTKCLQLRHRGVVVGEIFA